MGNDGYISFGGPSLDQIVAAEKGGDTRFRSLEVAVQPNGRGLSFSDKDTRIPPESEPSAVFNRLFGPHFRAPGDAPIIDPTLSLRRSVLDAVMADTKRLTDKVGASDRQRLNQHLSAIRDLEKRIARLEDEPPNLAACVRPADPGMIPDAEGRVQMSVRSRLMSDLLVMAYACDLTRVLSYWYSDPLSDVLYPDAAAGHHQLTHDEPGDMPTVNRITQQIMGDGAYFLEQMEAVKEGGTFDHCAMLFTTDVSRAHHQIDEHPILVAGRAGGRINWAFIIAYDEGECLYGVAFLTEGDGTESDRFGRAPMRQARAYRPWRRYEVYGLIILGLLLVFGCGTSDDETCRTTRPACLWLRNP